MPPFLPRKRGLSEEPFPNKRPALEPADPGPSTRKAANEATVELSDDDSESSLSSIASTDVDEGNNGHSSDEEEEEEDWEDALQGTTPTSTSAPVTPAGPPAPQDLELTLEKNHNTLIDTTALGKKGPSKIEREIRIQTHCMHVQFLLFHNAIRNWWINDTELHQILRDQLPPAIKNEIEKWEVAAGRKQPEPPPNTGKGKGKNKKKSNKRQRDWGEEASRLEPGQPDMSRGDPTIQLLRVLAAYWRKRFKITAPGLRKMGYRSIATLQEEISAFHNDDHSTYDHGERIGDLGEFRELARRSEGSRDVGAQLFTALLRALGIEARMVGNLQPIGFGWTKGENYRVKEQGVATARAVDAEVPPSSEEKSETDGPSPKSSKRRLKKKYTPVAGKKFDNDLPFPIYWTEAVSPITYEIIPVEALILPSANAVATTPELLSSFEPRGAKAEKAKQIVAYVVAYSPDATAKDVTTRYLKRHTWPGKTKGFRMPVEKIPMHGGRGPPRYIFYDWFKGAMRGYVRPQDKRTIVDDKEDAKDLVPNQPEKKVQKKDGDTLQNLRSSAEFVLERFLRREEAIRPGARHVRTFVSGKGDKMKEEKIYKRSDVEKCLSAESWHKEGRQIKIGEAPLKLVPIRAVTLTRKREVEEAERESGEKQKQGLYAFYQTEYIIPPPIRDGKIPKNAYGNIDCFVPTMVPRGATHIPWRGTVRICKKLGIDYAEAVTGFEFGSKMAVPIIDGVVVASENAGLVKDAWRADDAEKRKREKLKHDKLILSTWRKFIMGLRIAERIQAEYGSAGDGEERNPFTNLQRDRDISPVDRGFEEEEEPRGEPADEGGGFLLPGEGEELSRHRDIVDEMGEEPLSRMTSDMGDEDSGGNDNNSLSELSDAVSIISVHSMS
ncbi:xeroderma pigmentosum group C-complementing protein [[Emmonsia] crescens]|uniref:Xeroderma pigmentosum group C-complementing protein n=1 Tax=[Emmonsia] crescens TaxID=73230 RepID=A0A2B7ZRK9_9EURO|nr:xeroderma pigmentosum group C-complementing protein [Emmonsia crescens]